MNNIPAFSHNHLSLKINAAEKFHPANWAAKLFLTEKLINSRNEEKINEPENSCENNN